MKFSIKRRTGWVGSLGRVNIKVNGEQVSKLSNQDEITLKIHEPKASMQISQSISKSNVIEISHGDTVLVKSIYWVEYLIIFTLFLPLINNLFFQSRVLSYINICLYLIWLIVAFFFPGAHFRLSKINQDKKQPNL